MGALNLAAYRTRVKLACGNVPDSHPVIAADMHTTAISNAANQLIRENPDFFPEHQHNSWTIGPTVVGLNRVPLPENLLVLERVVCSRDAVPAGSPPSDWTLIQEYPVALVNASTIGLLAKPVSDEAYPTMCDRKSNDLLYNATTQAGFETYFRVRGLAGEVPLTAPGETFRMHRDFDSEIILYAAAETLLMMGQLERAAGMLTAAERSMQKQRGVVIRERAARPMRVRIAGMPRG